jgi:branched-chain amino acid transport system permease protein
LAILVAVFSPPILAVIFYKLLIERIKEYEFPVIILTFALVLLIQEGFLIAFQANLLGIEPYIPGFTEIFGASVSNQHLFALIIGGIILLGVWWLLSRTWLGNAIKAVSQDTETANLMGMDVSFIQMITVGISALLAGLAAVVVAPLFSIEPHMWFHPLIIVLAAVVLGGLGSLKGAVVGAFFLAFVEVAVISFIPQGSFLREAISLLAMVIVLTFRPEGLFGVVFEEERL